MWNTNEDKIRKLAEVVVHHSADEFWEEENINTELLIQTLTSNEPFALEPVQLPDVFINLLVRFVASQPPTPMGTVTHYHRHTEGTFSSNLVSTSEMARTLIANSFELASASLRKGVEQCPHKLELGRECGERGV